jgi:hypothetical protein
MQFDQVLDREVLEQAKLQVPIRWKFEVPRRDRQSAEGT